MSKPGFLPTLLAETDEFYTERATLLIPRALGGLALSVGINLSMIVFIYIRGYFGIGILAMLTLSIAFPYSAILISILRIRKSLRLSLSDQKTAVIQYIRFLLAYIVLWDMIAMLILPILAGDTRLIVICLYVGLVFSHALPLTLFPRQALAVLAVNFLPMSLQLTFLGDPQIMPLGLAGIAMTAMETLAIAWLYRMDMENLRSERDKDLVTEPDMSASGFKKSIISVLYIQSIPFAIVQVAVAFCLIITLQSPSTEAILWSWLLGFISVQTLRAASFFSFMENPDRRSVRQWQLLYRAGVIMSQGAWFVLLAIFYDQLTEVSLGVVAGILLIVGVFSTLGLTVDRGLFHFNSIIYLIPPILIMMAEFNFWMLAALGILALLTVIAVVENIHLSSLRALRGQLLQQLSEFRANKMQELNIDLTHARKRLSDVNASLESQIQERTSELKHQANHDMLTGLGNRYRFSTVVNEALAEYEKDQSGFAVYMLDLDRFKEINDGLGHLAGDQVLQETAQRIKNACDENRICARWGGDEFVILQKCVSTREEIYQFSEHLVETLRQPIELNSGPVILGASIGIAVCPEHGTAADALLEHSDIAVYRAKCMKDGVSVYNDHWGKEAAERVRLAQALRTAIDSKNMDVALQPFISMENGYVAGFEALARWPQPDGTAISPGVFIPLAEESGLMPLLGSWILRRSCEMIMDIAADSDLRIAINISVMQLQDPDFFREVLETLRETGLAAKRLEIEITENVFASDVEKTREIINMLRNEGIRISIDDFGTGYSSISYLRNFPLDTLKIDRSFVTALKNGGEGIYSSIVALARGLELSIIVEGVETEAELETVLRLGGDEIQGFFFAKPMSLHDVNEWLVKHQNKPFKMDVYDKTKQARLV